MNTRDFRATLGSIRNSPDRQNEERKIRLHGLRATAQFVGVGVFFIAAIWAYRYLDLPTGLWAGLLLVALGIFTLFRGTRSLQDFEEAAKSHDRAYFLQCIKTAQTSDELEEAGLSLSDNLVNIVADELAQEWDVFGPYNETRERMLVRLHAIADLRKLASEIEAMEQ